MENTLYNNRKKKYEDYIYKTELKKGNNFQNRFRSSASKEDINN